MFKIERKEFKIDLKEEEIYEKLKEIGKILEKIELQKEFKFNNSATITLIIAIYKKLYSNFRENDFYKMEYDEMVNSYNDTVKNVVYKKYVAGQINQKGGM